MVFEMNKFSYKSRQNNHQLNIIRFPQSATVADDTRLRSIIRSQIKPFSTDDNRAFVRGELALRLEGVIQAKAKENLVTSTGGAIPQPLSNLTKAETINTRKELAKAADTSEGNIRKGRPVDDKTSPTGLIIDFQANTLTEVMKRSHCAIMLDMLERLAECWMKRNHVTQDMLYALYELHNWTCPITGHQHSTHKPLTLEFLDNPLRGGKLEIANIRPRYRSGWYAGFYSWRDNLWFEDSSELIA